VRLSSDSLSLWSNQVKKDEWMSGVENGSATDEDVAFVVADLQRAISQIAGQTQVIKREHLRKQKKRIHEKWFQRE
jgi:hypothetical protein